MKYSLLEIVSMILLVALVGVLLTNAGAVSGATKWISDIFDKAIGTVVKA